jgi:protein-L-isoaspartate(D-aspartate) O-methyltransferase
MTNRKTRLDEARGHFARMMAAASGSSDPRIERAFEEIPREAFELWFSIDPLDA